MSKPKPLIPSTVFAKLRNPEIMEQFRGPFKLALGLDLGTNCGVAIARYHSSPGPRYAQIHELFLGQWSLELGRNDPGPLRFLMLKTFLNVLQPNVVFFEDVKYDAPVDQFIGKPVGAIVARVATAAEFLGSLKSTVGTWCQEHNVPGQGYGIAEIKKHATGKGNAGKDKMIAACNEKFGTTFSETDYANAGWDNVADAAHVLDLGLLTYGPGL